ncbi:IclR family transcriptional regulator [Streptomyces sp. NPDC020996]|uniref:IclR family transcriptional regulator n=1 Tax=Streptomyces sp. NPDC020996 TaxID=3154791 RepID=UPI0033F27DD1
MEQSSMGRGLDILVALAHRTAEGLRGTSVADLAREMDRDRSQLSRSLDAMAREEFAVREPRSVSLHWRLYADALDVTAHRLRTDGHTALEGMVGETGESCYLGVLAGDTTVTIAERVPRGSKQVGSWIGRPYPAYCSDCGQALLVDADDEEIASVFARTEFLRHGPNTPVDLDDFRRRLAATRTRGYSIVDEEAEPGLYSVAAPVRDFRGEVVAALQVVGPRTRLAPATDACADSVLRWADWLEKTLRGDTPAFP